MLKIDKTTHMMILFTFGLVFVSVYLYYTIIDVRRVQTEMKKLVEENEVRKAATSKEIEALSNAIMQLSVKAPQTKAASEVCEVKHDRVQVVEMIPVEKTLDKDDDSVITDDIRKSLDCDTDDDNVDVEIEAILDSDPEGKKKSDTEMSIARLQAMKYEELRDLCKDLGISYKGVKDVLYKRLHDHFFGETR